MKGEIVSGIDFKGMTPAKNEEVLDNNQATYARDVDLHQGVIRAVRADIPFQGGSYNFDLDQSIPPKRIFALPGSATNSFVILSSIYTHAASVVNVNGELEVWLTGAGAKPTRFRRGRTSGGFVVYDSETYNTVKVPAPEVLVAPVDPLASPTRYAVLRLAFVYADGYETPMGPPSNEFGYIPGDSLEIAPISAASSFVTPIAVRAYISVAGPTGADMRFFVELKEIQYTTSHILPNDISGEIMDEYDVLPDDAQCVCSAPWGGFAFTTASSPSVLQFTDSMIMRKVYPQYELNLGGSVTALLAGSSCIFALCGDAGPYVVSGTALANLTLATGSVICPLAATPAGATVLNDICLYVGIHGLMTVSSGGIVSPFTEEPIFNQEQWSALVPSQIALTFMSDQSVVFASPTQGTGILKPYGLIWRSGVRKCFATLPHDGSIVYL